MRKIPATMATQHPDNATAPFWDPDTPFITVHQETREAVICFEDFDTTEYMWDWEGKHADAAVIDRLFTDYHDYFTKTELGRDKFLTFRVPNIWEEKGYNLLQAMTVILSSEDFARDLGLKTSRPLFEVILPMTESAQQIMHMQELFEKLAKFKSQDFTPDRPANSSYLELIPLVESVESQLGVKKLLKEYLAMEKKHFKKTPKYLRVFLACSDSALSSGFLAGVLGNKLGLARLYEFSNEEGLPIYPITGSGSLPFRGGLSPYTVPRFMQEFPGVRTASIQSSFRYDNPHDEVKTAIKKLEAELPESKPRKIDAKTQKRLEAIIAKAAKHYKETINGLIADMQPVFKSVPKRRERHQHIGLLAYARSVGEQTLPRAITFTAGFYSVGVPPEFIAAGRTLKTLSKADLEMLKEEYPSLKSDLEHAGRFLNKANLNELAESNKAWLAVKEDVEAAEAVLGLKLEPISDEQKGHQDLSRALLNEPSGEKRTELIGRMAVLRRSLG